MSLREMAEIYRWMWRSSARAGRALPFRLIGFGYTVARDLGWATWAGAARLMSGGGLGVARLALAGSGQRLRPVIPVLTFALICAAIVSPLVIGSADGRVSHVELTMLEYGAVEMWGQKMGLADLEGVLDHYGVRSVNVTVASLTPFGLVNDLEKILRRGQVDVAGFKLHQEPTEEPVPGWKKR